ncbi:MAG: BrnT family toxin [Deltaproteobacteria bacterium]|nr:BrnT family toxin [Deltaproteobacteria bacterium]MBW2658456.1 BrnT family toxin [Deltaproteobacteria bacterium]
MYSKRTKQKNNIKKHSITFDKASTVFPDTLSLTIDDPLHLFQTESCL